ncbi:GPR1/FUN34/YaaH family transporter [Paraburkholderia sp. BR10937]|uniref:GPR1/FUN34/YaaH family transporter n=1 Tax=Paraburkholderia unamae TaxID=219649 RepID=A0ACC6RPW0_9BURK
MGGNLSNPAPPGLAGFAFTTWMLGMINAGWYSADSMGLVLALAFYASAAMVINESFGRIVLPTHPYVAPQPRAA